MTAARSTSAATPPHALFRAAALAVAMAGWMALGLYLHPTTPRTDARRHAAAGWGLARQALAHLRPGGQIVVITRDTHEFAQPALDALLDGFRRELRRGNARVDTVRAVESDPLRLPEIPSSDFLGLARRLPAGSVIVSLLGPPALAPDQAAALGPSRPGIVAFCPGPVPNQIDLRLVFQQQALDAAVVELPKPAVEAVGDPASRFAGTYRVVTATDVAQLYGPPAGTP